MWFLKSFLFNLPAQCLPRNDIQGRCAFALPLQFGLAAVFPVILLFSHNCVDIPV